MTSDCENAKLRDELFQARLDIKGLQGDVAAAKEAAKIALNHANTAWKSALAVSALVIALAAIVVTFFHR